MACLRRGGVLRDRAGTRAPPTKKGKSQRISTTRRRLRLMSSISRKTAIDNKTILFSLKGNKFMAVDLPGACQSLTPARHS
jgi:hypothetical protein